MKDAITNDNEDISYESAFEAAIGEMGKTESEDVKSEDVKSEDVKSEDVKSEDVKSEDVKSEDVKPEPNSLTNDEHLAALRKVIEDLKKEPAAKVEPETPKTDEAWEKFESDWPEVASVIRKERESIAKTVEEMVAKALEPFKANVDSVVKKEQDRELDKFVAEVTAVHPKAIEDLPELMKWVQSQPKHIAVGVTHVLENSTSPKEVNQIYEMFYGQTKPNNTDDKTTSLMKKMEAVKVGRTASTPAAISEDDYDSAFDEAVKQKTK